MKLFSAAGVFSGVVIHEMERIRDIGKGNIGCRIYVLWMLWGSDQNGNEADRTKFENAGKYCISKVYEGYHEWHVWRKSLYDF